MMMKTKPYTTHPKDFYNSFSIRVGSPVGVYTIFFLEDRETGALKRIDIHCGKAGSELRAWTTSISELLSEGLETGTITIRTILKHFSSQRADKVAIDDGSKLTVTSGPEAIALACQKYLTEKAIELQELQGANPYRVYGTNRNASYIPQDRQEFLSDLRGD